VAVALERPEVGSAEAGSQDHGELLELPDPEQRWIDERDRERIRWGVEWLRAWMPMENGGARFPHPL
jgi:hypothetical protein